MSESASVTEASSVRSAVSLRVPMTPYGVPGYAVTPTPLLSSSSPVPSHLFKEPRAKKDVWLDASLPASPSPSTFLNDSVGPCATPATSVPGTPATALAADRRCLSLSMSAGLEGTTGTRSSPGDQRLLESAKKFNVGSSMGVPSGQRSASDMHSALAAFQRQLDLLKEQQRVSLQRLQQQVEDSQQHFEDTLSQLQGQRRDLQELESFREEQREALAKQAKLFRREFEAAYRAEQTAEAALSRVGALERSLIDVRSDCSREVEKLRTDLPSTAIISELRCRLDEVTVASDRQRNEIRGQLSAAACATDAQHEEFSRRFDSLAASCSVHGDQISRLQRDAGASSAALQRCLQVQEATASRRVARIDDATAVQRVEYEEDRQELRRLAQSQEELAKDITSVSQSIAQLRAEARDFDVRGPRVTQPLSPSSLRRSPHDCTYVAASQVEEWVSVAGEVKSDVAKLSTRLEQVVWMNGGQNADTDPAGKDSAGDASPAGAASLAASASASSPPAASKPAGSGDNAANTGVKRTRDTERLQARVSALLALDNLQASSKKFAAVLSGDAAEAGTPR